MDGISRFVSDAPPAHYEVKVQSFSLLTKNSIESYESGEFEAGGYKWRLILHPRGNKSKNVINHISVYLAMEGTSSLQPCWEIYVKFRFFLLDQNNNNYLVVQDDGLGKGRQFHKMKVEWGCDEFIPLKTFNDGSNGYLVDDTCVLGAEVFVCRERNTGKGESLVMIKDANIYRHYWNFKNFSKLDAKCYDSGPFNAENHKWKIQLYPKGKGTGFGSYLSLSVALVDPTTLHPDSKIYTQIVLGIWNTNKGMYQTEKANYWFSASSHEHGWDRYILLSSVISYMYSDNCELRAEVTILGVVDALT